MARRRSLRTHRNKQRNKRNKTSRRKDKKTRKQRLGGGKYKHVHKKYHKKHQKTTRKKRHRKTQVKKLLGGGEDEDIPASDSVLVPGISSRIPQLLTQSTSSRTDPNDDLFVICSRRVADVVVKSDASLFSEKLRRDFMDSSQQLIDRIKGKVADLTESESIKSAMGGISTKVDLVVTTLAAAKGGVAGVGSYWYIKRKVKKAVSDRNGDYDNTGVLGKAWEGTKRAAASAANKLNKPRKQSEDVISHYYINLVGIEEKFKNKNPAFMADVYKYFTNVELCGSGGEGASRIPSLLEGILEDIVNVDARNDGDGAMLLEIISILVEDPVGGGEEDGVIAQCDLAAKVVRRDTYPANDRYCAYIYLLYLTIIVTNHISRGIIYEIYNPENSVLKGILERCINLEDECLDTLVTLLKITSVDNLFRIGVGGVEERCTWADGPEQILPLLRNKFSTFRVVVTSGTKSLNWDNIETVIDVENIIHMAAEDILLRPEYMGSIFCQSLLLEKAKEILKSGDKILSPRRHMLLDIARETWPPNVYNNLFRPQPEPEYIAQISDISNLSYCTGMINMATRTFGQSGSLGVNLGDVPSLDAGAKNFNIDCHINHRWIFRDLIDLLSNECIRVSSLHPAAEEAATSEVELYKTHQQSAVTADVGVEMQKMFQKKINEKGAVLQQKQELQRQYQEQQQYITKTLQIIIGNYLGLSPKNNGVVEQETCRYVDTYIECKKLKDWIDAQRTSSQRYSQDGRFNVLEIGKHMEDYSQHMFIPEDILRNLEDILGNIIKGEGDPSIHLEYYEHVSPEEKARREEARGDLTPVLHKFKDETNKIFPVVVQEGSKIYFQVLRGNPYDINRRWFAGSEPELGPGPESEPTYKDTFTSNILTPITPLLEIHSEGNAGMVYDPLYRLEGSGDEKTITVIAQRGYLEGEMTEEQGAAVEANAIKSIVYVRCQFQPDNFIQFHTDKGGLYKNGIPPLEKYLPNTHSPASCSRLDQKIAVHSKFIRSISINDDTTKLPTSYPGQLRQVCEGPPDVRDFYSPKIFSATQKWKVPQLLGGVSGGSGSYYISLIMPNNYTLKSAANAPSLVHLISTMMRDASRIILCPAVEVLEREWEPPIPNITITHHTSAEADPNPIQMYVMCDTKGVSNRNLYIVRGGGGVTWTSSQISISENLFKGFNTLKTELENKGIRLSPVKEGVPDNSSDFNLFTKARFTN